jgi:hypothetical protein
LKSLKFLIVLFIFTSCLNRKKDIYYYYFEIENWINLDIKIDESKKLIIVEIENNSNLKNYILNFEFFDYVGCKEKRYIEEKVNLERGKNTLSFSYDYKLIESKKNTPKDFNLTNFSLRINNLNVIHFRSQYKYVHLTPIVFATYNDSNLYIGEYYKENILISYPPTDIFTFIKYFESMPIHTYKSNKYDILEIKKN